MLLKRITKIESKFILQVIHSTRNSFMSLGQAVICL